MQCRLPGFFNNTYRSQAMKKNLLLTGALVLLAGCGGGEYDIGTVAVHGTVQSCDAASGANARVVLPYGEDQSFETTTDADGNFVLDVDADAIPRVSQVALGVYGESDACQPGELLVAGLAAAAKTKRVDLPAKKLEDLKPAHFVMSSPGRPLIHLGDDQYRGPANSKLQVATHGVQIENLIGTFTQDFKDRFNTAYIEFSARGMQEESMLCATHYENSIGLVATGGGLAEPVIRTVRPDASSPNGNFTRYSIPIDLTGIPAGASVSLVASSGKCEAGGTDHDDFELSGLLVRFAH